jgi:hypothetical protein
MEYVKAGKNTVHKAIYLNWRKRGKILIYKNLIGKTKTHTKKVSRKRNLR